MAVSSFGSGVVNITRPRKSRILEKAGLRYLAAWLSAETVEALHSEIEETEAKVAVELAKAVGGAKDE